MRIGEELATIGDYGGLFIKLNNLQAISDGLHGCSEGLGFLCERGAEDGCGGPGSTVRGSR